MCTNIRPVRGPQGSLKCQIFRNWPATLGVTTVGTLVTLVDPAFKKRVQVSAGSASVCAVFCELEWAATAEVLSARESVWEKLVRKKKWKRLASEQEEADGGNETDAEVIGVCHRPGRAVPDTGCAKTLIGRNAPKRHVEATGKQPRWVSKVRPVRLRILTTAPSYHREQWSWTGTWESRRSALLHMWSQAIPSCC